MFTQNCLAVFIVATLPLFCFGGPYAFSNGFCEYKTSWNVVNYDSLGIARPSESCYGFRSDQESCMTFPITYDAHSKLYLTVYIEVDSEISGIDVIFFGETKLYDCQFYGEKVFFMGGWYLLEIKVPHNDTTRVNIVGHSDKDEFVILHTYEYAQNNNDILTSNADLVAVYELLSIYKLDDLFVNNDDFIPFDTYDDEEGSGESGSGESGSGEESTTPVETESTTEVTQFTPEGPGSTPERPGSTPEVTGSTPEGPGSTPEITGSTPEGPGSTPETTESTPDTTPTESPNTPAPEESEEGFWTALTISLVAVGGVVAIGLVAGGAYYLGTLKSGPALIEDIEEPPRTVVIPRVRDVYSSRPASRQL